MPALKNEQHELFCQEYLVDLNATKAAERAGYAKGAARNQAHRLMTRDDIKARLAELTAPKKEILNTSVNSILTEMGRLASIDVMDIYNPDGTIKELSEMTVDARRAIKSVEIVEEFEGFGKNRVLVGYRKKLTFWDKTKALEMLGRYHRLFVDVVKHEGLGDLAERMKAARERSKKK